MCVSLVPDFGEREHALLTLTRASLFVMDFSLPCLFFFLNFFMDVNCLGFFLCGLGFSGELDFLLEKEKA